MIYASTARIVININFCKLLKEGIVKNHWEFIKIEKLRNGFRKFYKIQRRSRPKNLSDCRSAFKCKIKLIREKES
jgi:hypothetical protein